MGWPRWKFVKMLEKLEWLGYCMVKKLWRYIKPFSYNTSVLRMDRQNYYINIACQHQHQNNKKYPKQHNCSAWEIRNSLSLVIIIPRTVLWCCHHGRAISPSLLNKKCQADADIQTNPNAGAVSLSICCYHLHSPLPLNTTQPECWHSF